MVKALLAKLDHWLSANRPDYYDGLQPGVTDAELDAFEVRFQLKLPAAFRDLYRWRNGQEVMYFRSSQLYLLFSSLESIAETKESWCSRRSAWTWSTPAILAMA